MLKKTLLLISISLLFVAGVIGQGPAAANATSNAGSSKAKTKAPIFRPTKDQIIQVQMKLKAKNLYSGEAGGKYNDETRAGIKSFQKDNGLKETGTLNRATLEKFEVELTDSQKAIPVSQSSFASSETKTKTSSKSTTRAPIFRATVDQIKAAQRLLKEKTLYSGEETGKLNADTRAGLKKFQDESGMKATGTLNAATLEKMGIALTDKQKASTSSTAKSGN